MFEPREVVVKEINWNGEGTVEFSFVSGECWQGAERKDFWCSDNNWESIIKPGCKIRLWTVQYCRVIGFELLIGINKWESVWCSANDFDTKAVSKKKDSAYINFIKKEGKKIASFINKGKSLKEIDKLISKEHSGNTYGCALAIGIDTATNIENAKKVRKEHNACYGVKKGNGVVNPAVLTIKAL